MDTAALRDDLRAVLKKHGVVLRDAEIREAGPEGSHRRVRIELDGAA